MNFRNSTTPAAADVLCVHADVRFTMLKPFPVGTECSGGLPPYASSNFSCTALSTVPGNAFHCGRFAQ